MFTREKKLIALLLTAALAFTMNTSLFAAVGAEDVATVYENTTSNTNTSGTQTDLASPSQFEGYTVGEVTAVSENKQARPVSINNFGGVKGLTLSYNSLIPFFGKNIAKDKSGTVLGDLSVTIDGKKIGIKKAKVVYLKTVAQKGGAFPTVSNASIQITLDNKDLKALANKKDIKKAFKSNKGSKKQLGAAAIIVYPYRLNSGKDKDTGLKGKASKVDKAKLILGWAGKKYNVKSGKDMFGKGADKTFSLTADKKGLIVSTNEVWSGVAGTSENSVPLTHLDTNKFKADKGLAKVQKLQTELMNQNKAKLAK